MNFASYPADGHQMLSTGVKVGNAHWMVIGCGSGDDAVATRLIILLSCHDALWTIMLHAKHARQRARVRDARVA